MTSQDFMYEGPEDALEKSIVISGKTRKEVAGALYPDCAIETAKSRLSRALSTEHHDVNISLGHLLIIMRDTRPDDFINFLCDKFGFNRPDRKSTETIKRDIHSEVTEINTRLKSLLRQLPSLDEKNDHRK
jgi:hypothetical protein